MQTEHNRQQLDQRPLPNQPDLPPEPIEALRVSSDEVSQRLDALIDAVGGDADTFDGRLVKDLLVTALKLIPDGRDTGELKLFASSIKELRYAFRVFGQYPEPHKVSIFGSARTPENHPDYKAAVEFGKAMAEAGWMVITGAGDGIMKAGHEGPGREASFGVAIRLPIETSANTVIKGDEKLINFRYFFTRKLMFLFHAEAVALFPGGFGTLDEAYETLTLIQTGKASMIPIVLCEGAGQDYWHEWERATKTMLLDRKLISPEDVNLYTICDSPKSATDTVLRFYSTYHSSRYVRDDLVIRLSRPLSEEAIDTLNNEFAVLVKEGKITAKGPYDVEEDHR